LLLLRVTGGSVFLPFFLFWLSFFRHHISFHIVLAKQCGCFLTWNQSLFYSHFVPSVDAAIIGAIKSADKQLAAYLKSTFSLSNGDKPHALKF
jgi:hypothetical protein